MKKINKDIYIIDLIILIFNVILLFLKNNAKLVIALNIIFWIILLISLLVLFGYPRNKNYFKRIIIRLVIICCLSYLIIIYLSGLFLGFLKPIYSHTAIGIFRNIFSPILLIIAQEIVRYLICKRSFKDKKGLYLFTLLMIINEIFLSGMFTKFSDNEQIFIFICVYVLPIIAKQTLYTYLAYSVSCIPNFIIRFGYDVLLFLVPIYPDLGNYITSVFGVALPFVIYIVTSKILKYHDARKINTRKYVFNITIMPLTIFAVILVILISGIFKYKMIAIASNSMNPIYYRGDAVIYIKEKASNIQEGEILVFEQSNIIVTHRVIKKKEKNGVITFQTKGDNNNAPDPFEVSQENVLGKVEYIVKYVGYPTLWYLDMFKK